MHDEAHRLEGVPGTDASASKAGYYYQDVVTAVSWALLKSEETLHVEVAEDFAVTTVDAAQISQVRARAEPLTLNGALNFLEHVVVLRNKNFGRRLSFVFRTTASVGKERLSDRPSGVAGIQYWNEVKNGADPAPLIAVLTSIAPPQGHLSAFLRANAGSDATLEFIQQVAWATNERSSAQLESDLTNLIADIANQHFDYPGTEAWKLVPGVIDAVTKVSQLKEASSRQVNKLQLLELLKTSTTQLLPYPVYRRLIREASLSSSLPIEQVNSDIERRLLRLRQTRFFIEASADKQALALAEDVKDEGRCRIGEAQLRALALCWCARVLLESDHEFAKSLIAVARSISPDMQLVRLLETLEQAKQDLEGSLRSLGGERGELSQTVRYALIRRKGVGEAIQWISASGLKPIDFDSDGNFIILRDMHELHEWDKAIEWLDNVPIQNIESSLALKWIGGQTCLISSAADSQETLFYCPPTLFEPSLKDGAKALEIRARAIELFQACRASAIEFGLEKIAEASLETRLWLQLKNRRTRAAAEAEVLALWQSASEKFKWVPLAIVARVRIDKAQIACELDQRATNYGSLTFDDARARLAILFETSVQDWGEKWLLIRSYLSPYFLGHFLDSFYVQKLVHAGQTDAAKIALNGATDLVEEERKRLAGLVEGMTHDQIQELFREAIDGVLTPPMMRDTVRTLLGASRISDAIDVAKQLFLQTQDHVDAERWLDLLARENRWSEVIQALDAHAEQVEQSSVLTKLLFHALFRAGRWGEAADLVHSKQEFQANRNQVEARLAIFSGRWDSLGEQLARAQETDQLEAEDALRYAHLATVLGRTPLAKQLARVAATKSPDDPTILWNCYLLAVRGRWDDDSIVGDWIQKATATSGPDGPLQSKSLTDLMEMAPKWHERTKFLSDGVARGEFHLALVAQRLNKSLASMLLATAEANLASRDFRQRSPICAFAGIERPTIATVPGVVSIDQTALLTLSRLGIFEKMLTIFDQVWVPHSICHWLFLEYQDAQFHQPSRVHESQRLLSDIARDAIKVVPSEMRCAKTHAAIYGDELAQLIASCIADRAGGQMSFVVRPAPIYRVGSMMEAEADISDVKDLIVSTVDVLRSLRTNGIVTEEAFEHALSFLSRSDQGWPEGQEVPLACSLYLDAVAISYFNHLNLWSALAEGQFYLYVHSEVRDEAAMLDRFDRSSQTVADALEDARRIIVEGHAEGKIHFLPYPDGSEEDDDDRFDRFLLPQAVRPQVGVEAVIVDDRAANKYPFFSHQDGSQTRLGCSLDVIDWLLTKGIVTERKWTSLRMEIRKFGYLFVPVQTEELLGALGPLTRQSVDQVEPVDARAIRENHLLAMASSVFQLDMDRAWLLNHGKQISSAISRVWMQCQDDAEAKAKSSWLVELGRWDGLFDRMAGPWTEERLIGLDALTISKLVLDETIPRQRRAAYNEWLQSDFLVELERTHVRTFDSLCSLVAQQLLSLNEMVVEEQSNLSPEALRAYVSLLYKRFVNDLPSSLRDRFFHDDGLMKELGLKRSTRIKIHIDGEPSFDTESLYHSAGRVYVESTPVTITDEGGGSWELLLTDRGEISCKASEGDREFPVRHAELMASEATIRVDHLKRLAVEYLFSSDALPNWLAEVERLPLDPLRITALDRDLENTPVSAYDRTQSLFERGSVRFFDLIPTTRAYFNRLVRSWRGEESLTKFADGDTSPFGSAEPVTRAMWELLWSSHPRLVPVARIDALDAEALDELRARLTGMDLWSLTGLIEAVSTRKELDSRMIAYLSELIREFSRVIEDSSARLRLAAGLASMVDGGLNASSAFTDVPVFWRRHASFAHAALLERAIVESQVDVVSLASWVEASSNVFQAATLGDLWQEPRWNGFMLSPDQLKQELIGRVMAALEPHRPLLESRLGEVYGEDPASIESKRSMFFSGLPGPLEGSTLLSEPLFEFFVGMAESSLRDENLSPWAQLLAGSHVAGFGRLPETLITQLTESTLALEREEVTDDERTHWTSLFMRLSLAAAGSRNPAFAQAVRQLIFSREDLPFGLRVYAGITTCGSEDQQGEWTRSVATFVSQVVSRALRKDQADHLLQLLKVLGDARPLLRPEISRSWAQLQGIALGRG